MIVRPQAAPVSAADAAAAAAEHALPCWLFLAGSGDRETVAQVVACDPVRVVRGSSVAELQRAWYEERAAWPSPRLAGLPIGIGVLSYDLGRSFERLRGPVPPAGRWPDLEFRFYDALWVRDERTGRAEIRARSEAAAERLQRVLDRGGASQGGEELGPFRPVDSPQRHLDSVQRILEYVRAGDVYQVNLARRLMARLAPGARAAGRELFARLCAQAPAAHGVWLADPASATAIVGNSPELFLRVSPGGRVETRPIKGTRPRAAGPHDIQVAAALCASEKDRAEHVMIVDLERNDLGRVCVTGSVVVDGLCRLVSLPTVHHLVSTVSGQLRPEVDLAALLRATFPGGSVTGAPKIRAMEIIDELEGARRGAYTGATGWLGAAGDLELAVAIRTATVEHEALTLWVGGGIVAQSDPAEELRETEVKAAAFAALCASG